ncbi:MAG: DUF3426 domain-containing protein [Marinobacter sp.]|nr:DUF3426 domain-containing protein [Marinobacter sp.]
MSDSSIQTRCPHCETRFRVTDQQLAVADGKVRCGNCMEIFNAREHAVGDSGGAPAQAATTAPANTDSSEPASSLSFTPDDDLIFQDDPDEDAQEGGYAGSKSHFSEDELSDSFRAIEEGEDRFALADEEDELAPADESWAEAILSEVEKPEKPAVTAPPEPVATPVSKTPPPAPKPEPEPESSPAVAPTGEKEDSEWSLTSLTLEADEQPEPPAAPPSSKRPSRQSFHDLRAEPIAIANRGRRRSLVRGLLWLTIILALLAALVSQIAWYQFDRLSAMPQLRPYYEKACELAGCELKPLVALERIQSQSLVVRSHPEDRSSLIVDAVIVNRAEFSQPFPLIALSFSNLNGDIVAQSQFAPTQYLAQAAAELTQMTPGTPVRISITIRDPGRDAVNYNMQFRPAP